MFVMTQSKYLEVDKKNWTPLIYKKNFDHSDLSRAGEME